MVQDKILALERLPGVVLVLVVAKVPASRPLPALADEPRLEPASPPLLARVRELSLSAEPEQPQDGSQALEPVYDGVPD